MSTIGITSIIETIYRMSAAGPFGIKLWRERVVEVPTLHFLFVLRKWHLVLIAAAPVKMKIALIPRMKLM